MDGELHAMTGVSPYVWGSLVLETATPSPRQVQALDRALGRLRTGSVPSGSAGDLGAAVAVIRELARLQQDLTTGIGASDHVSTRIAYLRLAGQSRWFVGPYDDPPYADLVTGVLDPLQVSPFTQEVVRDLAAIRDDTVALRLLRAARDDGDVSTAGAPETPHQPELRLSSLLELDALCTTFERLATTQLPPDAQAWLDDHASLWWLPSAPPAQARVLVDVASAIGLRAPTDDPEPGALLAIAAVTSWLVDLACAYPARSHGSAVPDDEPSYDPVVRFEACLAALRRLDPEQVVSVREGVLGGRRTDAEAVLAEVMETHYLPSTEVYEQWVEELEPLAWSDDWDAPLFRLRVEAIRARLDGEPVRGPQAVVRAGAAIQAMVQGLGMVGLTEVEETSSLDTLRRALVERRFDMEVFELVHGPGVYRCPYARSSACVGERSHCVSGIRHLRELPSEDVCEARRSLSAAGWNLPPAAAVGPAPARTPRSGQPSTNGRRQPDRRT